MRLSEYFIVFALLLSGSMAESAVYRCDGDFGEPVFRQRPCGDNSTVAAAQAQGEAAEGVGIRASEEAWLRQREHDSRLRLEKRRRTRKSPDADARGDRKEAYQCRKKRRSLDEVRAKLRRGYKPASGEKLRRRRRAYEDYLAAFCP